MLRPIREYIHSHTRDEILYAPPSNRSVVSSRCFQRSHSHHLHHLLSKPIHPERTYPHAAYTRPSITSALTLTPSPHTTSPVRWSSITNPHLPDTLPPEAHPIHISLKAGETLYLPAGWWHHVRQGRDEGNDERDEECKEEKTIAVNWWYDFELRGMAWIWIGFLRGGHVPDGNT